MLRHSHCTLSPSFFIPYSNPSPLLTPAVTFSLRTQSHVHQQQKQQHTSATFLPRMVHPETGEPVTCIHYLFGRIICIHKTIRGVHFGKPATLGRTLQVGAGRAVVGSTQSLVQCCRLAGLLSSWWWWWCIFQNEESKRSNAAGYGQDIA